MNEIFLLILYGLALSLFVSKSNMFKVKELPRFFALGVFWLKWAVGGFYGWLHRDYFQEGDTFLFLSEARSLYESACQYPEYYLLGGTPPPDFTGLYTYPSTPVFWKDFGTFVFIHLNALLQPLTQGHYVLHLLFMALVGTWGGLLFFKGLYRGLKLPPIFLASLIFFMPSVLFWTSGLHKDGMVYLGLGLIIAALGHWNEKGFLKQLLAGLFLVLLFRYYLVALLLPPLFAYALTQRFDTRPLRTFLMVYLGLGLLLIVVDWFLPNFSLLEVLARRQRLFMAEDGGSKVQHFEDLSAGWHYLLESLPKALINVTARPFLWECNDLLQVLAALEILALLLLLVLWLSGRRSSQSINSLGCFMLFYALSNLLLIGLLVSNLGTIVRYRSIALGLIVLVAAGSLDYLRKSLFLPKEVPVKGPKIAKSKPSPSEV